MCIANIIQQKKIAFLNQYNPDKTIEKALSSAVSAAVQHNSLYKEIISQHDKLPFQQSWRKQLEIISEKYNQFVGAASYEEDIINLKRYMNEYYCGLFRSSPHPKYNYAPGFRISHSQKSISVYLKHLWCMGKIVRPPACPVDRIILKVAGVKYPENTWAYVNSIEEHRKKMAFLNNQAAMKGLHVADWELLQFGT